MDRTVQMALELWGMATTHAECVAQRENTVYRVTDVSGCYALRLHRPGYHDAQSLQSELDWMAALARSGMAVPTPRPSRNGNMLEGISGQVVDMLTWMPGRPLGQPGALTGITNRAAFCRKIGALLAQLHDISDAWDPPDAFRRPAWDRAGLLGDQPVWGPFWMHPKLNGEQRATIMAARHMADEELTKIEGHLDYGLIHADCIGDNIMVQDGEPALIDFDDCGFGFRDFELATFLMRFLDAPDFPTLQAAVLDGYASRRSIDPAQLRLFMLLRALSYIGWIAARPDIANAEDRATRAIATAIPLAQAFIAGTTPEFATPAASR